MIYNRALSQGEIQAIYNAGGAGKCFVPVPPSITTQPTNQTVLVGSNAIFSVAAAGSPTLTYQWFHGTGSITNATNSTLTLSNVQLSDAGSYHVTVNNPYGSTNSVDATLTVTNPVPACTPPPSGLVAWWRGEGNPSDSVGTNDGYFQGNNTYTAAVVGQGFAFSGQNNVTVVDSPALHGLVSAITMETWVKVNSLSINANSSQATLVGKGANSWTLNIFTPTGQIDFDTVGPSNLTLRGNKNVNDGQWHHVVAAYDGITKNIYVDGVLDASVASTGNINLTSAVLTLADNPESDVYGQFHFNGWLDEVSLYNRALSAAEVQAIYNAGAAGKCFGLTAPTITTQPTNQAVVVSGNVTFSVTACRHARR